VNAGEGRIYRATVEYDGTDYYGFQIQTGKPTIQGVIEAKLRETVGASERVIGAGRTDAGVHAIGQVISFHACWRHSEGDLERAMNARLPSDIAIRNLAAAPSGFHARFSALSRVYRYTVLNQESRSPLAQRYAYHVAGLLDIEAMDGASNVLLGRHDFRSFGSPTKGENSVREVKAVAWHRIGDRLTFDIEADGFLRRMVRTIVAALLQVGKGQSEQSDFAAVLARRERGAAPPLAPACGLCLMQVKY
jgi:tRNA pseudouridine38-40 synthase